MRKLLLITTALIGFQAMPARAEPVTTAIGFLVGGAGFGAVTSIWGMAAGTVGFGIAMAGIKLAGSLLLTRVAQALAGKPRFSSEVQRSELARPTSLPAYRFVYGKTWGVGTPVGWHVVGRDMFICYLLNSRPSALTSHTVLLDKRAVTPDAGNPFDFAGLGAKATNDLFSGHVTYWIGRGDQTSCPAQIVSGSGFFAATDAWEGRTVLWARINCGDDSQRRERWPASPPELNVEGDWSLIWDPRDDSHTASRNQGLIVLDALRNNPLREYGDVHLWLDTFKWAADVAEQKIDTKAGPQIDRYNCDGILVWSNGSELEDQIQPLLDAGGSRLVRVGGQIGIVPAVARTSVHTITDFTDRQPIDLTRWQPADTICTEVTGNYAAPDRAYELAPIPPYVVPGAQAADGGVAKPRSLQLDFVSDHRQGQRLLKIAALRGRMQRQVSGELFADAFALVAGSVATVNLGAPFTAWNGLYEVEQINPAAGLNDDQSITLRLPVTLRETSSAIYAWEAATEEQEVEGANLDPWVASLQPPASVTITSGGDEALIEGNTVTPRIRAVWPASISTSVSRYEWEFRTRRQGGSGVSGWQAGGQVLRDADFTALIRASQYRTGGSEGVNRWHEYQVRVRAVGTYGASVWTESSWLQASGPSRILPTPAILLAVGGSGRVDLTLRQGNSIYSDSLEVWADDTNDVAGAALVGTLIAASNVTVAFTETDLGPAVTRYYWLRARDSLGNASAFTASATATTT